MLQKRWKGVVDNKKVFGALLTDLSETFDCLSHKLIAKLNVYGFNLHALRLIYDFLLNRQQRTKSNHAYNSWEEVVFGVSQESALRPILFNIFLRYLCLIINKAEFADYAVENTYMMLEALLKM